MIFKFTLNSASSSLLTTALCDCTKIDLIFFTDLEASFTAILVASSQLFSELANTSITFIIAIMFVLNLYIVKVLFLFLKL